MTKYTATVIKSGNSYALRVPKVYVDNNRLASGQKVRLDDPQLMAVKPDHQRLTRRLRDLQKLGAYRQIKNPVAWQRRMRSLDKKRRPGETLKQHA